VIGLIEAESHRLNNYNHFLEIHLEYDSSDNWPIFIIDVFRSFFSKLYCYGFGSAIFFYVTVNMSMVLGLLPIVGSPLPLLSYGGSSMLATMIGFAIVMSAKVNHKQLIA